MSVSEGKIDLVPSGIIEGIVSKNSNQENNFVNTFKNQINIKPFFSNVIKDNKTPFELGFVFKRNIDIKDIIIPQITPIVGKLSKNGTKLINPIREINDYDAANISLSITDEKIISLTKQLEYNNIEKFLNRNDISENQFEKHIRINTYIFPIISELFELIKNKKFIYHSPFGKRQNPISISSSKPKISYILSENKDFFELNLNVTIDKKKYAIDKLRKMYFASFFLINDKDIYFLNSIEDDLSIVNSLKLGETVKTIKNNFDTFFNDYVKPISKKYPLEIKLKSINVKEKNNLTTAKQVFISEVDKFVIFNLIVQYNDSNKFSVFESGDVSGFNGNEIIKIERNNQLEQEFLEFFRNLHSNFKNQRMLDYFFLTYDDFLKDYWFFDIFEELKKQNIEVFGFEKLSKLKYNPNKAKVAVQINSGIDWFDVKFNIAFGDLQITLKDVKKAILKKERFVKLSDGSFGILPKEWIKKFEAYFRQGELKNDKIKISKLKFNFIEELFSEIDNVDVLKEIAEKKQKLKKFTSIKKI
ncbi:MAG: SNF2 helicase associated domain-containing protein, partial [Bacteroidota bacterium]|nr:SNF2 helicase associated domain-containing protein [Bacteroidota bacterium]